MTEEADVLFEIKQAPTLIKPPHAIKAVWQYFKIYHPQIYPHKKVMAVCLLCYDETKHVDASHAEVNYGESKSTSKLTQHIKSKHRYLLDKINYDDEEYMRLHKSHSLRGKTPSTINSYDSIIQEKLLKWIVTAYPSYTLFDQIEWKDFMITLNNKIEIPTGSYLSSLILQKSELVEELIHNLVQRQTLALGLEQWTTYMQDSYGIITAHWIDESWKYQQVTLSCKKLNKAYTLQAMYAQVVDCYSLHQRDVSVILCDQYSTLQLLEKSTMNYHICINNTIEVIIQQLLSKDMKIAIQSALQLILELKHSDDKLEKLKDIQRAEGSQPKDILYYGDSVWWLLHVSLTRLQELKPYLQELDQRKFITTLRNTQWDLVEQCCQIFEPFTLLQQYYESEKFVSVSMMPFLVNKLKDRLVALSDTLARPNILKLFTQAFKQYLEADNEHQTLSSEEIPTLMLLAAALDPRTKSLNGIPEEHKDAIWTEIFSRMQQIQSDPDDSILDASVKSTPDAHGREEQDIFSDLMDKSAAPQVTFRSSQIELQEYKAEPLLVAYSKKDEVKVYHDPLAWWREKTQMYPRLAVLARKILAIPTTSSASKRAFSGAGRWTSEARNKIQHDNASTLIFLQDNWDLVSRVKASKEVKELIGETPTNKRRRSDR